MSTMENRKLIPLTEVQEHTDEVVFGNLGLPSGFDTERLLVNLNGFDRIRHLAGLGIINIYGEEGDVSQHDNVVNSVNPDGLATMGVAFKKYKAVDLSNGSVSFPSGYTIMGDADAFIPLNTSETSQRIRNKYGMNGEYDYRVRARYLDSGIKSGLADSILHANFDPNKLTESLVWYGSVSAMATGAEPHLNWLVGGVLAVPILKGSMDLSAITLGAIQEIRHSDNEDARLMDTVFKIWNQFRHSMVAGASFDRIVLANIAMRSCKLVRARM